MAKKRRKKSISKCPEPFNTLIDIAGAALMFSIAEKKEKKYHYSKRGVPNPYRAASFGIASGKMNSMEDVTRLGAIMGAMGAFDDDNYKHHNQYAWRLNCEDGTPFGIYPENYETRAEYNNALKKKKRETALQDHKEDRIITNNITNEEKTHKCSERSYVLCRVSRLDNGENRYYHLSNKKINVGDIVTLPYENGKIVQGVVISIESYTDSTLPCPLNEISNILE